MTVGKLVVGIVGVSALLWCGYWVTSAHEAAERYIPIGQSPGASGKNTVIGKVVEVNSRDQTVAIDGSSGKASAKITPRTKIWLDRSKAGLTNLKGTLADLRQGATVEMKLEGRPGATSGSPAEWIKVQVLASP